MPLRSLRFCLHPGCSNLTGSGYCPEHESEINKQYDRQRGSAQDRGYDARWNKYSKWFLSQPENQICMLHLPGCGTMAQCVDHIIPPAGKEDPLFWDTSNHQAACIHCNSVKGRKIIKGNYDPIQVVGGPKSL